MTRKGDVSKLVNEGIQNLQVPVNIVFEGPLLEDILRISRNSNEPAPFKRNYSCTLLKTFPFKTFSSLSILTGAATFAFNQFNFLKILIENYSLTLKRNFFADT